MAPVTNAAVDGAQARAAHRALLYADAGEFVEAVVAFVREGLRSGEALLVALAGQKAGWVRDALGAEAGAVEFVDSSALYVRNGPMLSGLLERLACQAAPGRGRMRIVAEQALAGRRAAELRAYMRYEAAANVAYRPFAASVLCPYDTARVPEAVLERVRQTHPELREAGTVHASGAFCDPREFVRRNSLVERPPPDAVEVGLAELDDISRARHRVTGLGAQAGLAEAAVFELEVAVGELAANALEHGRPPRRVWAYVHEGAFVCQVQDGGRGLTDPLAGYLVPDVTGPGGRGLWLAHQLCDVVEAASDQDGSRVCVRMRL